MNAPHQEFMPFVPGPNYGVWRRGSDIVMHKLAPLPAGCVKCGTPVSQYGGGVYKKQKFRWHHPAVYIACISPLIYVILALALGHRFEVDIPYCDTHRGQREQSVNILAGGIIGAIVLTMFSIMAGWFGTTGLLIIGSVLGLSIYYEYFVKALQVRRVEGDIAFLKGASESYLCRLPIC